MTRPHRFWWPFVGAFAATFAAVDLWANGNAVEGDTFSEQVRALNLPDVVLGLGLFGSAGVLFVHWRRRAAEVR